MQTYLKQLPIIFPKLSQLPLAIVPSFIQQKAIAATINHVMKDLLDDGELEFLSGRFLEIKMKDLNTSWFFTYQQKEKTVACYCQLPESLLADVCISGDLNDFILLCGQGVDPDTLFFKRHLTITGDTELGLEVKNSLDEIEFTRLPKLMRSALNRYISLMD